MPSTNTLSDVLSRARAFLNDQGGMIWPDQVLLPHAQTAYRWAAVNFSVHDELWDENIEGEPYSTDLIYTASQTDLSSILPVDMWLPVKLEFRVEQSDDWREINRVSELETMVQPEEGMIRQWCFRNRDIFVTPVINGGFLRLSYIRLLPAVNQGQDAVQMDMAVEMLAYYTAYSAYLSRGQAQNAAAMLGAYDPNALDTGTGARGIFAALVQNIVQNKQQIGTRGRRFDSGRYYGTFGPWSL